MTSATQTQCIKITGNVSFQNFRHNISVRSYSFGKVVKLDFWADFCTLCSLLTNQIDTEAEYSMTLIAHSIGEPQSSAWVCWTMNSVGGQATALLSLKIEFEKEKEGGS